MELLRAPGLESFHISDKHLAGFEDDEDSGLSSSPSTPGLADNEAGTHLFEFENGLTSNLCEALNMCLFDGEFPNKLYTHINIKEESDDESWQSNVFPGQLKDDMSSSVFGNIPGLTTDFFGEQYELLDDLLTTSLSTNVDEERAEILPLQTENKSNETLTDSVNSAVNTDTSTNTAEESASVVECSPGEVPHNPLKRKLRTRNKVNVMDDHNYVRSSDEAAVVISELNNDELDEKTEGTEEEDEEDDDDDEDFKPTCSAKKSRRTSNPNLDKDTKYWERRNRNNLAAKRSREAKRAREMAVAKKTSALEKENTNLKRQVQRLKAAIAKAEKKLRAMV